MRKTLPLYRYERQAVHRRTADVAKRLGVTPTGLEQLAKAVASNGEVRGGIARTKLVAQGYATADERVFGAFVPSHVTDAGREIVRQARELGW
jgi:hypothetical protein